jgi:hypothetical protein
MRKSLIAMSMAAMALAPAISFAQHQHDMSHNSTGAQPKKMTAPQKIANAMGAAPASIAKSATIMDWPATEGGKPSQLRAGSSDWVCFPNSPGEYGRASIDDPMCLDKQWQAWGEAWMSKTPPKVTGTGIGYMLKGDKGASNTDPYATGPTADNQWVVSPAHIMVLYEDAKMLDAFTTDPKSGGPWVMWKGTPYAHLMVPVSSTRAATMGMKTAGTMKMDAMKSGGMMKGDTAKK